MMIALMMALKVVLIRHDHDHLNLNTFASNVQGLRGLQLAGAFCRSDRKRGKVVLRGDLSGIDLHALV